MPADMADADAVERAAERIEQRTRTDRHLGEQRDGDGVRAGARDLAGRNSAAPPRSTYLGTVNGTMAALKRMAAAQPRHDRAGRLGARYRAIPLQSAYCGAKYAIRGFTDSLRCELIHDRHQDPSHDGPSAGGQHAAIRLGAQQDATARAAGAADLPAGGAGAGDRVRRDPSAARDLARLADREGDPGQQDRPGPARPLSRARATAASSAPSRTIRPSRAICSIRCPAIRARMDASMRWRATPAPRCSPAATATRSPAAC